MDESEDTTTGVGVESDQDGSQSRSDQVENVTKVCTCICTYM